MREFDFFDEVIQRVREGQYDGYWKMSDAERLYVALGANRHDLLKEEKESIVSALARIGSDWQQELIDRYRYTF